MATHVCTPHDLIELAELLADGESEAAWRAAAGRAYYAGFHAVCDLAHLVPGSDTAVGPQGKLKHREVPRRLRSWQSLPIEYARLRRYSREAREAAVNMQAAIATREMADYYLSDPFARETAELQIARAKDVLEFAQQMAQELNRLCSPPGAGAGG